MNETQEKPKTKRLATTYIDAIKEIAVDEPVAVASKVQSGTTEYHKRVWVRTSGGSYLLILTSQEAEALSFNARESAA